jgi:hypothetical protein
MKLITFQNSVNAALWHLKLRNHKSLKFLLSDAASQHYIITRIVQRSIASLFDTDLQSLNFTRLAIPVVTSDRSLNISVFYCLQGTAHYRHITAHCTLQTHYSALHTTDTLQRTAHYRHITAGCTLKTHYRSSSCSISLSLATLSHQQ